MSNKLYRGLSKVVVSSIVNYGEQVSTERLATWLKWCVAHRPNSLLRIRDADLFQKLATWQKLHPDLMNLVIAYWLQTEDDYILSIYGLWMNGTPPGIGKFLLSQLQDLLTLGLMERAKWCLLQAYNTLERGDENSGFTLEDLEKHVYSHPELNAVLQGILSCELENNRQREMWQSDQKYNEYQQTQEKQARKNLEFLLQNPDRVRSGDQRGYLYQASLADIATPHQANREKTPRGTVESWLRGYPTLRQTTNDGYLACLKNLTNQVTEKALECRIEGKELTIELPCLLGADQLFERDLSAFLALGEERIRALLVLHFCQFRSSSEWFLQVADLHSDWIAETWLLCALNSFKRKTNSYIPNLSTIISEPKLKSVATLGLPQMLKRFPAKFAEARFNDFAHVLVGAMQHCPQE